MSRRKNGVIIIIIASFCLLLLTQIMGDNADTMPDLQESEQVTGIPINPSTNIGNEDIKLTAAVFMEPDLFKLVSEWNEEFQSFHPGTTVSLTNLAANQSYLFLKEQASAGESPDIMLLNNNWISEFAALGYLSYQTNDYISMDTGTTSKQGLSQTKWNGYTWAVPHSVDPYVVVLNPSLISINGEGKLPNTVEDWLGLHEALLLNDPNYEGIHIDSDDPQAFISLIWALQGNWSNETDHMYTLNLDQDSELLESLMSIFTADGSNIPLLNVEPLSSDEYWLKFDNNQYAAMVVPLSEWIARPQSEAALSVSLLSENSVNNGLWLSGTSYAVSAQTIYQEMAYSWISWMTDYNHQIESTLLTYELPIHVTSMDLNNILKLPQPELLVKSVDEGQAWGNDPELTKKLNIIKKALDVITEELTDITQFNEWLELEWEQAHNAS